MAVSISMSIRQNSQSIENNTSNVTVEVYAWWTNGSYNAQTAPDGYPQARGTVTIDDVAYAFYSKFNTGHTTSGYGLIFSKTLDISHNNEGEKVLSCWASYATGVSSGTVSTSGSLALTTIPRKSVLTAPDGTLGSSLALSVKRKSTLLTHTVTYSCRSESGAICTKSTSESLSWTPPISLAAQYPNSTSVPVALTITTYNGDTEIGSSAVTITCAVPASVVPSISLSVSDYTSCLEKYGAYVQGKSKLRIVVTAAGNQGSAIKSYKVDVDGKSYTKASVTTEVITGTGELTVQATVTDSRGRTATESVKISVLAYTAPTVGTLSVSRCDANGNASNSGAYLAVRFSASITALNSKNSAAYTVKHKKTGASAYYTHTLTGYAGQYSVSNGVYIFSAETAYSYDVVLTAKDDFTSTPKSAVGSSVKKLWSILTGGAGFAFGKIAEKANTLDMGWDIELNQNEVLRDGKLAYVPNKFGLGTEVVSIGDASVDTITGTGFYYGYNGLPELFGYSFVIHIDNGMYAQQLVFSLSATTGYGNLFIRREKCDGVWDAWEWENPPMFPGEEYRTTERYDRKPVYTKLLNLGAVTGTNVTIEAEHGIVGTIIGATASAGYWIAPGIPRGGLTGDALTVFTDNVKVYVTSYGSWGGMPGTYALIKYVKN